MRRLVDVHASKRAQDGRREVLGRLRQIRGLGNPSMKSSLCFSVPATESRFAAKKKTELNKIVKLNVSRH